MGFDSGLQLCYFTDGVASWHDSVLTTDGCMHKEKTQAGKFPSFLLPASDAVWYNEHQAG